MLFLLCAGLFTSYSFPNDNEFTPGQEQKEFVYNLAGKKSSRSSKNSEKRDNTDEDADITRLDLSQALRNETSTEDIPA